VCDQSGINDNPNPLNFVAFRRHCDVSGNETVPDPEDFYQGVVPETDRDREAAYRWAQARKLNRLFERWKAEMN
jgi:hypothetical protein